MSADSSGMAPISLDPTTVAVLAHGMLNGVSAISVAFETMLRSHPDQALGARMSEIVDGQLGTLTDALRLLTQGLPDEVIDLLTGESR